MAKRPIVPAALHAELTEYSSLLRALRTSKTLDLTTHLTEPPPPHAARPFVEGDDVSVIDDDAAITGPPPPTQSTSRDYTSEVGSSLHSGGSSQSHNKLSGKANRKAKERDTWTRWPLLAGDVHVPEWGLAEEVKHIAERVLAASEGQVPPLLCTKGEGEVEEIIPHETGAASTSSCSTSSDDEEDMDTLLSHTSLQALTADSATFLARVFASLAAHVPAAAVGSMQNRVRPICWETVIDVALANDIITTRTATAVRERMSHLYPPRQPDIVPRMAELGKINAGLATSLSKHDDRLLLLPARGDAKPKTIGKKRGPYKKRNATTEVNDDVPSKRKRSEDG
ncbi:hypothetical protein C8Q74DRAFT_1318114 [Fomes fomentarius]|nr:hypothetical protein C8Q74DRAFT_1318114 [Fomes fomentarius]